MTYATALALPSWTAEIQGYSQKVISYTPIVFQAFNKTLAPVIIASLKGTSLYFIQRERLWYQWAMTVAGITHNPIQAAVRSAHAELTSAEAQTTYSRVRHITRETAMDALVLGLCGVVAVATTIETAQTIYRHAVAFYGKVDAWLNPAPVLLPSAEMALAANDLATALAIAADVAEAQAGAKALPLSVAEPVPDFWFEPMPLVHTPPISGPVWNSAPGRDMHTEVERLLELQSVPVTLAAAEVPVEQPTEQAPAEDELASFLDVPGATGGKQRKSRTKASTCTAAKPKRTRAGAK